MNQDNKKSFKTLLMSVLFSLPGPLILGLGLMVGHSSTQISDFTRRTAELLALVVAFVIYTVTSRNESMSDADKRELERKGNVFTGIIMCVSGTSMILLTAISGSEDKGNVVPALVIAFLGVVANVFFWRRYTALYQRENNAILGVQARLYRAKSAVDICVTSALLAVLLLPGTKASYYIDIIGSVLVSIYMIYCGIKTIKEHMKSVDEKTAGNIRLAVLLLITAIVLIVSRKRIFISDLGGDILHCIGVLAAYIVPCVLVLLLIWRFTKVPSFIFRKLLHIVAFTCVSLTILAARSWQGAALASVIIALVIYPLLSLIEDQPWYDKLFVQKSPGEIKRSMIMLFFMFAACVTVCWGVFSRPELAATSILMWGVGDASAALIGIPFGKHKVKSRLTDGKKSWEGSAAMLAASFAIGLVMLIGVVGLAPARAVLAAAAGALLGTAAELFTPSEYDTVTVPTVIAAVLIVGCCV